MTPTAKTQLAARATATAAGRVVAPCPLPTSRLRTHSASGNRRHFLAWLALLPVAGAAVALLRRLGDARRSEPVVIPADIPAGLTIRGDVVVNRAPAGELKAFAARCTHLGCRLERVIDGVIVCSCHGSRFHADGRVATGPAARPLVPLRVERDPTNGGWIVHAG